MRPEPAIPPTEYLALLRSAAAAETYEARHRNVPNEVISHAIRLGVRECTIRRSGALLVMRVNAFSDSEGLAARATEYANFVSAEANGVVRRWQEEMASMMELSWSPSVHVMSWRASPSGETIEHTDTSERQTSNHGGD